MPRITHYGSTLFTPTQSWTVKIDDPSKIVLHCSRQTVYFWRESGAIDSLRYFGWNPLTKTHSSNAQGGDPMLSGDQFLAFHSRFIKDVVCTSQWLFLLFNDGQAWWSAGGGSLERFLPQIPRIQHINVPDGGKMAWLLADLKLIQVFWDRQLNVEFLEVHLPGPCTEIVSSPIQAVSDSILSTLSCQVFVKLDDSTWFAFGRNQFGQLGLGLDDMDISVPTRITALDPLIILNVECGIWHTVFTTKQFDMPGEDFYICGWNKDGALGFVDDTNETRLPVPFCWDSQEDYTFVKPGGRHMVVCDDDKVQVFGLNSVLIESMDNVIDVVCGPASTIVIHRD